MLTFTEAGNQARSIEKAIRDSEDSIADAQTSYQVASVVRPQSHTLT